ncbi:MAG TPA: hypothetical protein VFW66_13700 [Gemmatimonadales bacterium]|nr:hypothetical protein [Gemmatimonadales bacterium]
MNPARRLLVAAALVAAPALLAPGAAAAQGEHGHAGAPPERLGRVVFPVSCTPKARPLFVRGVALLHSFWYEEAGAAFRQVVAADSTCAMGYWGQAMSALHLLWEPPTLETAASALEAAEQAVRLTRPDTRERDYAEAIATFYRGYTPAAFAARIAAYEHAMAAFARHHAWDEEGRIFYALALIAEGQLAARDTTYAFQRRAVAILEPLFRIHPDHPGLAHYLIHACDSPALAARAINAAERYARIAPSVPHAQHMPSHIFTRVGRWDASIASNLRAAAAAGEYERSHHLAGVWPEHAHAFDYLVYAYLQEGRDREAGALVDSTDAAPDASAPEALGYDYARAAIPARYALERGRWADAEELSVHPAPAWPGTEALTRFARALGAARAGDLVVARAEVDTLGQLEAALARTGGPQTYWSMQVRIQREAAAAWLARATGDTAGALQESRAAADLDDATEKHPVTPGALLPARELYGEMLLELSRPQDARRAFEAALARQPNRARSLFGAARAAAAAGDSAGARAFYRRYERLMAHADGDRPELAAAREALAAR